MASREWNTMWWCNGDGTVMPSKRLDADRPMPPMVTFFHFTPVGSARLKRARTGAAQLFAAAMTALFYFLTLESRLFGSDSDSDSESESRSRRRGAS